MMAFHERRLPHFDLVGHPLFITFRLHGSLPAGRVFLPERLTFGEAFAAIDRILDKASTGPRHLAMPKIAEMVVASILAGESRFHRYELDAFAVMPNHVHILVTPHVVSTKWLGPLKGFTAHEANRILGHAGPFWQDESYDHVVRAGAEMKRIRCYIENNPVTAGLVAAPEDFPWSSVQAA